MGRGLVLVVVALAVLVLVVVPPAGAIPGLTSTHADLVRTQLLAGNGTLANTTATGEGKGTNTTARPQALALALAQHTPVGSAHTHAMVQVKEEGSLESTIEGGCLPKRVGSASAWPTERRWHASAVMTSLPPHSQKCRQSVTLWVFGGAGPIRAGRESKVEDEPLCDVFSYSLDDGSWYSHPPIAMKGAPGLYHHSAVWTGESSRRFLIFGGTADGVQPLGELYEYDPYTGESKDQTTLTTYRTQPSPRYGHTAVYLDISEEMLVYGGRARMGYEIFSDLWAFLPRRGEWRLVATNPKDPTPSTRFWHAACGTSHKMYLWGGRQRWGRKPNDLWEWNPQKQLWSKIRYQTFATEADEAGILSKLDLVVPKGMFHARCAAKGNVYLVGGTRGKVHWDAGTAYRISADGDADERYPWTTLQNPREDVASGTLDALESFQGGYDTAMVMFGGDVSRLEYYWAPFWAFEDGVEFVDYELKTRWVRGPTDYLEIFSAKDGLWKRVGGLDKQTWWFSSIPPKPAVEKPEAEAAAVASSSHAALALAQASVPVHGTAEDGVVDVGQALERAARSAKAHHAPTHQRALRSGSASHAPHFVKGLLPVHHTHPHQPPPHTQPHQPPPPPTQQTTDQ